MGQKSHPLALRIASGTRRSDIHWYTRKYKDKLIFRDIAIRKYFENIAGCSEMPQPRIAIQHSHVNTQLYPYICTPFTERKELGNQLRLPMNKLSHPCEDNIMWSYLESELPETLYLASKEIKGVNNNDIVKWVQKNFNLNSKNKDVIIYYLKKLYMKSSVQILNKSASNQWLLNHITNHVNNRFNSPTKINFVRVTNTWQDAGFLADEIVWFLERRVTFRIIKRALQRAVEDMPHIRGVRVSCAGRVGARSKKAQRARCDVWKHGATPLHVFSKEIDYAQRIARTSLGIMGISVWLTK
jgi:hypothetical protein